MEVDLGRAHRTDSGRPTESAADEPRALGDERSNLGMALARRWCFTSSPRPAADYLAKPFNPDELLARLARLSPAAGT